MPSRFASPPKILATLATLAALAVLAFVARVATGPAGPGWPSDETILSIRAERATLAALIGASLALAGALLQILLRNPLAAPDLMGLSAGATVGVMASFAAGALLGLGAVPLWGAAAPAVIGAAVALAIVYLLSQTRGLIEPVTMLLAGVVVAIIAGSLAMLLRHTLPPETLARVSSGWMLGQISEELGWPAALALTIPLAISIAWAIRSADTLDIATLSDDEARSLGARLGPVRVTMFLLAGVLTAAAVVVAGPIGFVGLVAPHAATMLVDSSRRAHTIAAVLLGAMLMLFADTAAANFSIRGGRLPVGVVTALIGGPIFLWMLRRELAR